MKKIVGVVVGVALLGFLVLRYVEKGVEVKKGPVVPTQTVPKPVEEPGGKPSIEGFSVELSPEELKELEAYVTRPKAGKGVSQPGPKPRVLPEISPADIAAGYGKKWALGKHPKNRRKGLTKKITGLVGLKDTHIIGRKLLDYYLCEAIVTQNPTICDSPALKDVPDPDRGGKGTLDSLSNICVSSYWLWNMINDLRMGKSGMEACRKYFLKEEFAENTKMSADKWCGILTGAYKKGGIPAICPALVRAGWEAPLSECRDSEIPTDKKYCKGDPKCNRVVRVFGALVAGDAKKCPGSAKASCQVLVRGGTSHQPCQQVAGELSKLYNENRKAVDQQVFQAEWEQGEMAAVNAEIRRMKKEMGIPHTGGGGE